MVLTFTVKIKVDRYGENWVPYIRHLITNVLSPMVKVKAIFYEDWLTQTEKQAEIREKIIDDEGGLEL